MSNAASSTDRAAQPAATAPVRPWRGSIVVGGLFSLWIVYAVSRVDFAARNFDATAAWRFGVLALAVSIAVAVAWDRRGLQGVVSAASAAFARVRRWLRRAGFGRIVDYIGRVGGGIDNSFVALGWYLLAWSSVLLAAWMAAIILFSILYFIVFGNIGLLLAVVAIPLVAVTKGYWILLPSSATLPYAANVVLAYIPVVMLHGLLGAFAGRMALQCPWRSVLQRTRAAVAAFRARFTVPRWVEFSALAAIWLVVLPILLTALVQAVMAAIDPLFLGGWAWKRPWSRL